MDEPIKIFCPQELRFLQPYEHPGLIRIGNLTDGGYVLPKKSILRIDTLVSLGLGENWTFERELSGVNHKLRIHSFDDTVSLFFFTQKLINGIVKFLLGRESFKNVMSRLLRLSDYLQFWRIDSRNSHQMIRIDIQSFGDISTNLLHEGVAAIKIDIEGSEWEILEQVSTISNIFEFIVIEVHDFDSHEEELKKFLADISNDFVVVHLHANNFDGIGKNNFPKVFELTIVKRDAETKSPTKIMRLPVNGMDSPNAKNRPDFEIFF
jgi:hypothetical protein